MLLIDCFDNENKYALEPETRTHNDLLIFVDSQLKPVRPLPVAYSISCLNCMLAKHRTPLWTHALNVFLLLVALFIFIYRFYIYTNFKLGKKTLFGRSCCPSLDTTSKMYNKLFLN